jgi:hypothetical protein
VGEAEAWIGSAGGIEPRNPLVLLARARLAASQGRSDEGQALLAETLERLREMGFAVWIPFYEALAGRWGLRRAPPAQAAG